MDMQFALGDMSNVVVLEIQYPLRVLDDGRSVGSDEEFDRLRETVFGHERPRLGPEQLLALSSAGRDEEVLRWDLDGRGTGAVQHGDVVFGALWLY